MENLNEPKPEVQNLGINYAALAHLEATRKWTLFLSILGFVFIGLMLLFSVFISTFFRAMDLPQTSSYPFPMVSFIPLLVVLVIYFFPIFFLFQFSRYSKIAITSRDETSLAQAFKFLKLHYQFMGVLAIIGVAIYALAIIGILIGGTIMGAL